MVYPFENVSHPALASIFTGTNSVGKLSSWLLARRPPCAQVMFTSREALSQRRRNLHRNASRATLALMRLRTKRFHACFWLGSRLNRVRLRISRPIGACPARRGGGCIGLRLAHARHARRVRRAFWALFSRSTPEGLRRRAIGRRSA